MVRFRQVNLYIILIIILKMCKIIYIIVIFIYQIIDFHYVLINYHDISIFNNKHIESELF